MTKLHVDELDIDAGLARSLLAAQFPQWADLTIDPFPAGGTVNVLYRLGEDMAVRLPRVGGDDVEMEHHWLPRLTPLLPSIFRCRWGRVGPLWTIRFPGRSSIGSMARTRSPTSVTATNARYVIREVLADCRLESAGR